MNKKIFSIVALFALSICGTSYAQTVELPEQVAEVAVEVLAKKGADELTDLEMGMQKAQAHAAVDYLIENKNRIEPVVQALAQA